MNENEFRKYLKVKGKKADVIDRNVRSVMNFENYVKKSGWDGMVPNPSDLEHNIKSAKKLKEIVEK